MPTPHAVREDELQLWLSFMTAGIQIHKMMAVAAGEFADACLEEFHQRRPAVIPAVGGKGH